MNKSLLNKALLLAVITVFYNLLEGAVSIYFGVKDETLSLFGFGIDSFVEVLSGIGIWHLIYNLKLHGKERKSNFEKRALKITGTSFYILTAGLLIGSAINIFSGHKPESTLFGIIISTVSIFTMWLLIKLKLSVGNKMDSKAVIADANCTKTCLYLSLILLASSLIYELSGIGWIDSIGSIAIAYLSYREGRESFVKAESEDFSCACCSGKKI